MALFRYKAVSPTGETLQGQMEATSSNEVIAKLQEAGNMPILAEEAANDFGETLSNLFSGKRISQAHVGMLTEQLAVLLTAGLPLDRALSILGELAETEALQNMVKSVRDQVRGGAPMSDSLESQHGIFSRLYINMVRAGEVGGTLDVTLTRLADYLKRSKELKDSVISAMIYPIILLVLAIGSLFVLLGFVVPKFTPIFEDLGGDLPTLTKIVLGMGDFLQSFWWLIGLMVIAVVVYFRQQFSRTETRMPWDQRLLKFKMLGDLIAKIEMARLSRTVGTLLTNGVPLLASLSIGKNALNNTVMRAAVDAAAKEVKTGDALGHALAKTEVFPKLALQMVNVGEETGHLDEMLNKVADTYDDQVRITVDRIMSLLTPILTLSMAAFIAMIVMAILMAILSVNDLIAG